jgi:putative exosortase-associated protein (TIGR04073 family)
MRKTLSLLSALAMVAVLAVGCAGPEAKFGRGVANITEIPRMGEMNRALEQGGVFEGPDAGMATGFIRGVNKSLTRTGVGIYEIVTAPFPPYDPVFTDYISPRPAYPDGYRPRVWAQPFNATDTYSGFGGGEVAPWFPGSRFRIFENN